MLLNAWIMTAFFVVAGSGVAPQQYVFKTKAECLAASNFHRKQYAHSVNQQPICYPSYVQVK